METQKDMHEMLEMMMQPSFFVKQGMITTVNQAARQLLIEPNTPVCGILGNNMEEYEAFQSGCLCLTLTIAGCNLHASVRRLNDYDLFVIDQAADLPELKAMALTATGLREPLSAVMALSTQLLGDLANSSDPSKQAKISEMNRRLSQLHRNICNMAEAIQYETNSTPPMSYQDICAVLAEIFDKAAVLLDKAGFTLHYCGPREPIYCAICPERLERAIYNILSNSMKSAPNGCTIEAKLTHRNSKLYLSVQDDGPGVPEHLLSSIHCRYLRNPGIESHPWGLGLGMVLIRGAAAAHGGAVLIDQPKEHGTRITMSIAIRHSKDSILRSTIIQADYAGGHDHGLLELSDVLSPDFY